MRDFPTRSSFRCAARLLPFGWDAGVAATILNTDRWNAGQALMRSTNPVGWATPAAEMNLVEPNHATSSVSRSGAADEEGTTLRDRRAGAE